MAKNDGRKTTLFFLVIVVLIALGVVMFLPKQMNNKIVTNQPASRKTITGNTSTSPTYPTPTTVLQNVANNLINAKINKISFSDPVKLDVSINIGGKEVVKTVIIKSGVELVLHNMSDESKTNRDVIIKSTSLNEGDTVAIWILESSANISKLNQLTATRVIKLQ